MKTRSGPAPRLPAATTATLMQLQRFKKRKLKLRDEITMLENMLIPDIIA
jgi:hypothetical protein